MRWLALVWVCALALAVPSAGSGGKPPPQPVIPLVGAGDGDYKAPKADGPVVELLDEGVDAFIPVLNNDGGGEAGTATREDRDAFAGVEALRVTPMQKYRGTIPGWNFPIVEKPQAAGEFRHLRFAWKKIGGRGLTIQLHDPIKTWAFRYYSGQNVLGWQPNTRLSVKMPVEWVLVTRDLWRDHGTFTLGGIAFSPHDGTAALFDHMLLGRTVEDLDKATDAALGRVKPAKALAGKERDTLWADLLGSDRVKAATAQRAFLASATDHVGFVAEELGKTAVDKENRDRVQTLLKDLDADAFEVRDRATDELVKLGSQAIDAVCDLAGTPPNDEVAYRTRLILRRMNDAGQTAGAAGRSVRVVRVLERAATPDARTLLSKLAQGELGFAAASDAKAALGRLEKKP